MNRRGFLGMFATASVATTIARRVQVRDITPSPPGFISWTDLRFRLSESPAIRVTWKPYGPLDFIDLPSPAIGLMATQFGVSFHCADGCLYHLTGHPGFSETWSIHAVADIARAPRNY